MDDHWRNSMRPPRFLFGLDARAALPLLIVLTNLVSLWTWGTAIVMGILFMILENRGLTFDAALRAARAWLVGPWRPRILASGKTHFTDTLGAAEVMPPEPGPSSARGGPARGRKVAGKRQ